MELPDDKDLEEIYDPVGIVSSVGARPKLVRAIRQAAKMRHIYLYAPPGSGKTSSVLQWLAGCQGAKAWITLTERDVVPDIFFKRLALAFLYLQPDNGRLRAKLEGAEVIKHMSLLAEEVAYCLSDTETYLVLDRFEHITDGALIRDLVKIIRTLPKSFAVTVIDREEPQESFSDLILRNQMSVINKDRQIF